MTGPRQAWAIGIVLGFAAIGTALGPFVGGTFSEYFSWRGVFFINVPFCIAAIFLVVRDVRESCDPNADRHIDVIGMPAITGGLVCISLAFDRGAASDAHALNVILRAGAVPAFVGAAGLFAFGRPHRMAT